MDNCSTPAQNPTTLDVLNASIVVNSTAFRTGRLPWADTVEYHLKNWILSPEHFKNPYPTDQEKQDIMKETGIDSKELKNCPASSPPPLPPPYTLHCLNASKRVVTKVTVRVRVTKTEAQKKKAQTEAKWYGKGGREKARERYSKKAAAKVLVTISEFDMERRMIGVSGLKEDPTPANILAQIQRRQTSGTRDYDETLGLVAFETSDGLRVIALMEGIIIDIFTSEEGEFRTSNLKGGSPDGCMSMYLAKQFLDKKGDVHTEVIGYAPHSIMYVAFALEWWEMGFDGTAKSLLKFLKDNRLWLE
ncbi:hypothetical protein TL16_g07313 [Triparma laevis f. inornata]|uniref:KN homeodomain domain-containing protein n=1 Tax=Triparma laevis f. inornata TaxID=1714386 RepID=A0A9W7AQ72_9STRA|nr:hypothetical protein TL16_g07313 [Triparma laevis f. inornata]